MHTKHLRCSRKAWIALPWLLLVMTSLSGILDTWKSNSPDAEIGPMDEPRFRKRSTFLPSAPANLTRINGLSEAMSIPTGKCHKLAEIGGNWYCQGFDGNKDVCLDPWYTPAYNSCLIYSFGVGNDITFEKIMSDLWGCQVFLHDHTVNHTQDFFGPRHVHRPWGIANVSHVDDDGRTLVTYKDALAANGHVGAQVHYLKIDIEENEYNALPQIIASGLLENVWQLHMEVHNFWRKSSEVYIQRNKLAYEILSELENAGFRRVRATVNNLQRWIDEHEWGGWCCSDVLWVNERIRNQALSRDRLRLL